MFMVLPSENLHCAWAGGLAGFLSWQDARTVNASNREVKNTICFCMGFSYVSSWQLAVGTQHLALSQENERHILCPAWPKCRFAVAKCFDVPINDLDSTPCNYAPCSTAVTISPCRYSTRSRKNWNTTRPCWVSRGGDWPSPWT